MQCASRCCTIHVWPYTRKGDNIDRWRSKSGHQRCGVFLHTAEADETDDRILVVLSRNWKWGIPKGSVEGAETSKQCAARELLEETGVCVCPSCLTGPRRISGLCVYESITSAAPPFDIERVRSMIDNDVNGLAWIKIKCLHALNFNMNVSLKRIVETKMKKKSAAVQTRE